MEVKPITPDELGSVRLQSFPPEVIKVFNGLITQEFQNGRAVIVQEDVLDILDRVGIPRATVLEKGYLNVEEIYRDAGWSVKYDKPAYNETYHATFTFSRKGKD